MKTINKTFYTLNNVGKAKYTVNFYSGIRNKDNSRFYDIRIFKSKNKRDTFINELFKQGYIER